MKKILLISIVLLMLVGCSSTGSKLVMDFPMPDGTMAHIEATGDVLVTYSEKTQTWEFLTEQIKAEQTAAMSKMFEDFLSAMSD